MKASTLGLFAVALAITLVGALWAGVPLEGLLPLLLVLACPLMMLVMMHGMHGGSGSEDRDDERRDQHLHR